MVVTKKMRQSSRRRNEQGTYRRMNNGAMGKDYLKQMNGYRKYLAGFMDKLGFGNLIKGNR